MQNCWLAASRSPARFESKAAFHSLLLRLLIDEAQAVPNKNQSQFAAALIDDRKPSLGHLGRVCFGCRSLGEYAVRVIHCRPIRQLLLLV